MLKLSDNLRRIILERDLSVSSISRKSGVPKTNIQGWLDGASPNIVQLSKVANSLGLSLEALAFGKETERKSLSIFEGLDFHNGIYEISIRKVSKSQAQE